MSIHQCPRTGPTEGTGRAYRGAVDTPSGPAADVEVDADLALALVAEQHPDLVAEVRPVAEGWDNVVFRLGRQLAVRLPRRRLGAELVATELEWLPGLAGELPLEVPVPVRAGEPGCGYPYPWSIVRWVEGDTLLDAGSADPAGVGAALGRFCAALHADAPADAPHNPWRGGPLAERSDRVARGLDRLPGDLDRSSLSEVWACAVAAPAWTGPPVWVHGDLHPGNVVVGGGTVVGVIDFGDLTAGDPATDLSVGWMLADRSSREALIEAYGGLDEPGWARARGHALAHAVAVLGSAREEDALARCARGALVALLSS